MTAYVLVLSSPASDPLPPACVAAICALLGADGAIPHGHGGPIAGQAQSTWQHPFDLPADTPLAPLLARLRLADVIAHHPIDLNVVPAHNRGKRLLIADMESTIIQQEMLDELGDAIGARAHIEDITARAMRGELDFEAALDARVGLLAGLDAGVLEAMKARITLMPGAQTLVATMKAQGATCALVSGGFTVFTAHVAALLGFDTHRANVLEIADGKLTGRVRRPILGREAKLAALRELAAQLSLNPADVLAVGDGANDLAMLGAAGLGVAFRAKPMVQEAAAAMLNGAVVTHGDLTALLALQGYAESDVLAK